MALRHIFWTDVQGSKSYRRCSFSTTASPSIADPRWFIHDQFPASTCRRIIERLRDEGLKVSDVWPCKPWGAGFHVQQTEFEVLYMISPELRNVEVIEYTTMSWCSRPIWKHPDPERVTYEWGHVIERIEKILPEDPSITSFSRGSED